MDVTGDTFLFWKCMHATNSNEQCGPLHTSVLAVLEDSRKRKLRMGRMKNFLDMTTGQIY